MGTRSALMVAACLSSVVVASGAERGTAQLDTADTRVRVVAERSTLALTWLGPRQSQGNWLAASPADVRPIPLVSTCHVDGRDVALEWRFQRVAVSGKSPKRAVFTFTCEDPALELRSEWTAWPGPGPVEHRITIANRTRSEIALLPFQPTLVFEARRPADHALEHWWVEKGAQTPGPIGTHTAPIAAGYSVDLLSLPYADDVRRDPIPWSAIQDTTGGEGIYLGVESSARVRISLSGTVVEAGYAAADTARTRLAPGETFEAAPAFVGWYLGDVDDGANRMRRWVEAHIRPPVKEPRYPVLVNNSWGSGMAVDERLARAMIDDSAAVGIEMYHIDAGWFRGVGDWHASPDKFPNGLGPVVDYVHSKGLLFGLWVGWTQGGSKRAPAGNHTALSVFDPEMRDWFTQDYPDGWNTSDFTGATVCLGASPAADWCLADLRRIVGEYKLDLLEHDQPMIVEHCGRTSHLHTADPTDVSYRAAQGYCRVYDTLRSEHPKLLFEDCVNGGHMVDYGVLRRTHYVSITDTYDPLSNRRAFHDSSYALPPSMCECYVADQRGRTPANFLYMLRSGMMGWCTIMCDTTGWTPEQHAAAKREFALYKDRLRPLIAKGNLYHVSVRPDGVQWDGMQYYDPANGHGVLFAFRGSTAEGSHTFALKGLDPAARYRLTFEDGSAAQRTVTGKGLMDRGLEVRLGEPESSEIVLLEQASSR